MSYIFLASPFLIWHEWHLPWFYILILVVAALGFGSILFFASIHLFSYILKYRFHFIFELLILCLFLLAVSVTDFLQHDGGLVFIGLFGLLLGLTRIIQSKVYYPLLLLGSLLFSNALLSFWILQKMETLTAYHLFRSQIQFAEVDLDAWSYEEEKRILKNPSIPIRFRLPEEMYFFNANDLDIKDKTGTGQIAGIISASERDPNSYPFVRIFFFPAYVVADSGLIHEGIVKYLSFQEKSGEIEEINEIQPDRDFKINNKIPANAFWTFFDLIRPRYAKTGYIFFQTTTGSKVLLHITENLEKGSYHEGKVKEFLESIQL